MSSYPTALENETLIHRVNDSAANTAVRAEMTDNQLVDLALAGDSFAFEQIFGRHKRLVAVIASRYFRKHDEVEEIIQIGFAKAFSDLNKFRGENDRSLASWLVRITANACIDSIRSRKRKPETLTCELSDHEIEALLESTADNALLQEKTVQNSDLTEKLLAGIPAEDRALMEMLYAEEMSIAEIADVFGWSTSNVKVRAWRARTNLRKILKKIL